MFLFHILFLVVCLFTSAFSWYHYPPGSESLVPGDHGYHGVHNGLEHASHFMNEWTVHVEGDEEVAQLIALELGYVYGGPVVGFPNTYTFLKYEHSKQRRTSGKHTLTLARDRRIKWAEQLFSKLRVKRYPTPDPDSTLQRVKRIDESNDSPVEVRQKREMTGMPLFNDELWNEEWYLQDTRNTRDIPRLDLNVLPVYAMGFNGSGVRVSVLDDGIEHNHTDLRQNYDPDISWDCNDGDPDPSPRKEELSRNSHGTRCAGEIAMTANNVKCGVGVAWGAKVGGVRMLDGRITDRIEGEAIGYAWDKVDIYSASWGPNDDGSTVEGPGRLAMEAFKRGIFQGRGGKGAIYVWANGNGGSNYDNCNCDGYSSSIYTVSIASASQHGLFPWYGEVCSSTLATAYSSGAYKDQKIATTDTGDSCTLSHTGTSAAAPLAAGIIALVLDANSNLTWRDVQHLIVWTSDDMPLTSNPGWQVNSVGLRFDIRFGFGILNAEALVKRALNWVTVPEKQICHFEALFNNDVQRKIYSRNPVALVVTVNDCIVNYLEHVELIVNIQYSRRGALEVYLESPRGTMVQLLSARPKDSSTAGLVNWPLMSVATWGENPKGNWNVIIEDKNNEDNIGEIGRISLILHGTKEMPAHMKDVTQENNLHTEDDKNSVVEQVFSDDDAIGIEPEEISTAEAFNEVDPTLLAAVEKELLRVHHRMKVNRLSG